MCLCVYVCLCFLILFIFPSVLLSYGPCVWIKPNDERVGLVTKTACIHAQWRGFVYMVQVKNSNRLIKVIAHRSSVGGTGADPGIGRQSAGHLIVYDTPTRHKAVITLRQGQARGYFPSRRVSLFTTPWPVPNYTAWWRRHACVNNLPKVVAQHSRAGVEPETSRSPVQRSTRSATASPQLLWLVTMAPAPWTTNEHCSVLCCK